MQSVSIYDPFADVFPTLFRGLFDQQPVAGNGNGNGTRQPAGFRVDVRETPDAYTVHADLPGVNKDQIAVEIDGNQVTIRAEARQQAEHKEGQRVLRAERFVGQFARSFVLGSELDEDKSSAKYENGVLELVLPKKQQPAAKRLTIA